MPKVGDKDFDYTPEGMEQAKDFAEATGQQVDYAPGGSYDAMNRSSIDYAGAGNTGYNKIGMYRKGGKIEKVAGKAAGTVATRYKKVPGGKVTTRTTKFRDNTTGITYSNEAGWYPDEIEAIRKLPLSEAALKGYINVKDIVKSKHKKKKKKK